MLVLMRTDALISHSALALRFYNALFWYGAASEDREQLPAMNFQDLMERFDAFNGPRPPGTSRVRPRQYGIGKPKRSCSVSGEAGWG